MGKCPLQVTSIAGVQYKIHYPSLDIYLRSPEKRMKNNKMGNACHTLIFPQKRFYPIPIRKRWYGVRGVGKVVPITMRKLPENRVISIEKMSINGKKFAKYSNT